MPSDALAGDALRRVPIPLNKEEKICCPNLPQCF